MNNNNSDNTQDIKLQVLSWCSDFMEMQEKPDSSEVNETMFTIADKIAEFSVDASTSDITVLVTYFLMTISHLATISNLSYDDIENLLLTPASLNVMTAAYG